MATDWGGSGNGNKDGNRGNGGGIPCPIVTAMIVLVCVASLRKIFRPVK